MGEHVGPDARFQAVLRYEIDFPPKKPLNQTSGLSSARAMISYVQYDVKETGNETSRAIMECA